MRLCVVFRENEMNVRKTCKASENTLAVRLSLLYSAQRIKHGSCTMLQRWDLSINQNVRITSAWRVSIVACRQYVPADETGYIFELNIDQHRSDERFYRLNTQNILLAGLNVEEESNWKWKISQKTRAEILRHWLVSFTRMGQGCGVLLFSKNSTIFVVFIGNCVYFYTPKKIFRLRRASKRPL